MASWWDNIGFKKGTGGHVTQDQKNSLIEQAVSTWSRMGLTDDEIALGIGIMGIESGFYPQAKHQTPKHKWYGLGQLRDDTWEEAVNHYNTRPEHKALHERNIDPVKGRDDLDSQIAVMGPWIRKTWARAGTVPMNRRPTGYSFDELAYGKWHQGQSETPEDIATDFFHTLRYEAPYMRDYFIQNVDRARQALRLRRSKGIYE